MMQKIKISIIVPFYNTPIKYFSKCIEALKKIDVFEVILVDDCSEDKEIIEIAKESGFKYLKTKEQSKYEGIPFNLGVRSAIGDYVCKVDSDDALIKLPKTVTKDICFGRIAGVKSAKGITIAELIDKPRALINATIIKKEIFLKYPYAEDDNVFADTLFLMRALNNNYSFEVSKTINYIYNRREGSIQTSKTPNHNKLRNIQTVARFCQLEQISRKETMRLLEIAMSKLLENDSGIID